MSKTETTDVAEVLDIAPYLQNFLRKPFEVQAVQVTEENLEIVADWCGGDIRTKKASEKYPETRYIRVPVKRPLTHRQTLAYPGDWVLAKGKDFKSYTNDAFVGSFDPAQTTIV